MVAEKQDANLVGFYKIREATLGVVPATGSWQTREPNKFKDFGAEYSKTARKPFSPSRQRKKGSTTDLDADGGYNEDLTQNNMQGEFEEFFFAAMREKPNQSNVAATVTTNKYTVASSAGFLVNSLINAAGFTLTTNNGLKVVTAIADATHVTAPTLATEASGAGKTIEVVGYQFPSADASIAVVGGKAVLTSAAINPTTFGLIPGEWIFVGGDGAGLAFATIDPFYARVYSVSATAITFDKTTQAISTDAGTGKTIQIFFGPLVRNEDDPDDIVQLSSVMERTLGRDADGVQSEYLTGAVANEMTWDSPLAGLVSIDMSYIGQRADTREGIDGPLSARVSNDRIAALGEDAFNTSSNIYRIRMAMVDPDTLNPTPFFARVTEWKAMFKNNVSSAKAQGVLGGFDAIAGMFDVDVDLTAYFTTVEAIHAVKCNWDATFDSIYAKDNAGVYVDIPLLALGGGRLSIEQDAAIMLPLKSMAAESAFGHTALIGWFNYLPDAAMPDSDC